MAPAEVDGLPPPGQDPALRAAEQLVPGEADHVRPGRDPLPDRGLLAQAERRGGEEGARPEIVDHPDPGPPPQVGELGQGGVVDEPLDPEVGAVDREEDAAPGGERPQEVGEIGPVRGPHLDQVGSGPAQHVRDPEPPPDLDQLAPGDQDLGAPRRAGVGDGQGGPLAPRRKPLRQGRERQQDRRGAVVHHHRRLRAGEPAEGGGRVAVAIAPLPGGEVELEVPVPGRLLHGRDGPPGEGGPAEVGVDHDAGGVHDRPEGAPGARGQPGEEPGLHLLGGRAGGTGRGRPPGPRRGPNGPLP